MPGEVMVFRYRPRFAPPEVEAKDEPQIVEKWKDDLDYIKKWLPLCEAKGLVEVKDVTGNWTSRAFAGYGLPEETASPTV
ncbi:hypothetical protein CDEST_12515 [Colletotrichum destructivum]|uniref:Uncharacterized protein n=1 Tax=Colletotrichum destructivum TaxID=34406 RepID=A0AAX4IWT6_9PEZI|nr:hypothetical protein CDEST_12515 [Colletotrichum destructivum]